MFLYRIVIVQVITYSVVLFACFSDLQMIRVFVIACNVFLTKNNIYISVTLHFVLRICSCKYFFVAVTKKMFFVHALFA